LASRGHERWPEASFLPRGKRRPFRHTFISASLGGHAFVRKGKERFPIHKLFGLAIPAEMVKAASELAARLSLEVDAILAGRARGG
jgi:hypothetical protein